MCSQRVVLLSVVSAAGLLLTACSSVPESNTPDVSVYACGQLDIQTTVSEESGALRLSYLDKQLLLQPEKSASGALYVASNNENTRFWSKGERATLTIQGQTYPQCLQPGTLELPFRAQGNEPFWHAETDSVHLTLTRPHEENGAITLPVETVTANKHGSKLFAEGEDARVTLTVADELCEDTMSDVQFPNQVKMSVNGSVYNGCGGTPERLFRGAEWIIEDLAGGGIIDSSRIAINFLENGRIGGAASCNRYSGSYQLTGEGGMTFDHLALTRMACASALMNQENRFLNLLSRVSSAKIGPHGELLLMTSDGETLKAFASDHAEQ